MPRFAALLLLAVAAAPTPAAAPLDPQANEPYLWRVVVQSRSHPRLTPAVRDQLGRDVRAALVSLTGPLARVEVIDLAATPAASWEPLWKLFADRGWPALDSADARKLTGAKTHFLRVEFRDGAYRLEARQVDGDTGLSSPVLRVKDTTAPETVGRLAGLLLGRDFGPVCTVEKANVKEGTATVRFRAGAVGGLDKFVRPGDVLSVAAVVDAGRPPTPDAPPPRAGQPRGFTLLRVTEPLTPDGTAKCQLLSMYANPLPNVRGVAGFRGLKLATVEAPVAVRLVKPGGDAAAAVTGLTRVRASDIAFPATADPRDALELRDGIFRSPRPMRNVACVVVGVGRAKEIRFPVPVLGESAPVLLPFEASEAEATRAAFEKSCEDVRVRAAEVRTAQVALFDALGKMIEKGENPAALARVEAGLKGLESADQEISAAVAALRADAAAKGPIPDALLKATEKQLEIVRTGVPALRERRDDLTAAIEKSKDPVRFAKELRSKSLMADIKRHVADGEVPLALDRYDELIKETKSDDAVKQRDKLAAEWEPKGPEHEKAREFVATEWRRASTAAEFTAALPPLREAFGELTKNDDMHGLRAFLASLEPAYTRLKELAELLDAGSAADRPVLQDIDRVAKALREMETRAREKLTAGK
ncbi:MAG: hypothetical protein ACRC7O_10075 [Fimbriiglobus sp.]